MEFTFEGQGRRAASVGCGVIAGWTARDRAAVDHHIAELAAIGVAPPSTVPLFYRVAASLFTTAERIEVVGRQSSGEVEPVLYCDEGRLWLGVGSDHTDRALEAHSVALSKQACAKPVAPCLWPLDELADRLDGLVLRSWVRDQPSETWRPYQEGTLAAMRPLAELMRASPAATPDGRLASGTMMMCGTLGVLSGGVRPARFFRVQLHDAVRGRQIEHEYETLCLPEVA